MIENEYIYLMKTKNTIFMNEFYTKENQFKAAGAIFNLVSRLFPPSLPSL